MSVTPLVKAKQRQRLSSLPAWVSGYAPVDHPTEGDEMDDQQTRDPGLTPTAELTHEHEVVLVVVAAMEREATRIRAGGQIDSESVEKMVLFTREFTDGCHHTKEEKVLFPLLSEKVPMAVNPVNAMLAEHELGRAHVRTIAQALPEAGSGDPLAALTVASGLEGYAGLLRAHIEKENKVLFPLAERSLGSRDKSGLAAEFERVEREETGEGVHEKYHALARELGEK
jgi:hemerythrin-like domain-containing protein